MYLLLADPFDRLSDMAGQELRRRGLESRTVNATFGNGLKFSWRLDNDSSISHLTVGGEPVADDQIDGVFVRSANWIDPRGWLPDDLSYIHTETQSALLGWLRGLTCPVAGRMPASVWYRPQMPIPCWQPLLARCGLRATETLVTNIESEVRGFRDRFPLGAVYAPFSAPDRYLIASDEDWNGLVKLTACAPVCLAEAHGPTRQVCVIGERVIWDGEPPSNFAHMASSLLRFTDAAELNFVEFSTADSADGVSIVGVNPLPVFEHFGEETQQQIVRSVVEFLTRKTEKRSSHAHQGGIQ